MHILHSHKCTHSLHTWVHSQYVMSEMKAQVLAKTYNIKHDMINNTIIYYLKDIILQAHFSNNQTNTRRNKIHKQLPTHQHHKNKQKRSNPITQMYVGTSTRSSFNINICCSVSRCTVTFTIFGTNKKQKYILLAWEMVHFTTFVVFRGFCTFLYVVNVYLINIIVFTNFL